MSLGGCLVGYYKQFKYVTLGFRRLGWPFIYYFLHDGDIMIVNQKTN